MSKYNLQILSIGIPAVFQGAVFCLTNIFVQAAGLRIMLILLYEPVSGLYEVPAGYLKE